MGVGVKGEKLTSIWNGGNRERSRRDVENQKLGQTVVVDGRATNERANNEPLRQIEIREHDLNKGNRKNDSSLPQDRPNPLSPRRPSYHRGRP